MNNEFRPFSEIANIEGFDFSVTVYFRRPDGSKGTVGHHVNFGRDIISRVNDDLKGIAENDMPGYIGEGARPTCVKVFKWADRTTHWFSLK